MKYIILSLLSLLLLPSCTTLDTYTVRTVTPTPRYYRVLPTNHLYQFNYRFDRRPDYRPDYLRYYNTPRRVVCRSYQPALRRGIPQR